MSLVVANVSKQFRDIKAVDQLSFSVPEGKICGFLGPNGAGKTTTVRMILGIITLDEGSVTWKGEQFGQRQTGLYGYLPEERGLYPKMRLGEHLVFLGRLYGLSRAEAQRRTLRWLDRFSLGEYQHKRIEELSKGNQQKAQTIGALLHEPPLLILDEPFSGLDPVNSSLLREALLEHHRAGNTVLFSSHRMEQVEELCEEIALINKGRLVLSGNLREIKRSMGKSVLRIGLDGHQDFWRMVPGLELLSKRADYLEFRLTKEMDTNYILSKAMQAGTVTHFELTEPTLNQIFVEKVGVGA